MIRATVLRTYVRSATQMKIEEAMKLHSFDKIHDMYIAFFKSRHFTTQMIICPISEFFPYISKVE